MVALRKTIRDISLVRGVRSVATRCAGIIGKILGGVSLGDAEVPHTLKVEVLEVSFGDMRQGKRRGRGQVSVTNLSVELVDRLTMSLILKQDGVGPIYTVEQTYQVQVEPGDCVEVDLDLGEVPLDDVGPGLVTEVRVLASRHISRNVPTYVLPESSTGVCAIEERFALDRGLVVERIDISLSRNLLRNKGWAQVMFVIRNDKGISHHGLTLVTRFYSMSGVLLGEATDIFQTDPLGVSQVNAKVTLQQARGLGATRFEAQFEGFEDIGKGGTFYRGVDGISATESKRSEEWEGEEVKGAYWVDRPSR